MSWTITAGWERLESGSPEERACFAAIGIQAHNIWLTEGRDAIANRLRHQPLLSAYHLAEWLTWNWWRLRWEPRSRVADWEFAHRLSSIGGGYIWPNITIFSDGQRTALIAKPTLEQPQTPFRYIADAAAIIPATEFESELDRFIEAVIERLDLEGVEETNLHTLWNSLSNERRTPEEARKKKLEALLGYDPDKADPRTITQLTQDVEQLSRTAIEEIAAEHGQSGVVLTAADIHTIADRSGFNSSPRDVVRLTTPIELPESGNVPAWLLGREAARALRGQLRLDSEPISDEALAEMGGAERDTIESKTIGPNISFAFDQRVDRGRVVLRSKWRTGRRFEFARLLGDRVLGRGAAKLFPATRAYTYRQKMQRAFAAEFLSPFEAVDHMLQGDYSMENQLDVAEHFGVSSLTIRTLLVNHGRLEREDLNDELETVAAESRAA
jgi:hypothetical protein